jgi:hypothetical protein
VARIDKTEPHVGSFRARLAATWLDANKEKIVPVGLDANGRVVLVPGVSGFVGVICTGTAWKATQAVDIMTGGEIVDVTGLTGQAAGTKMYVNATTGAITATPPAVGTNAFVLGQFVENGRLIVRWAQYQGGA